MADFGSEEQVWYETNLFWGPAGTGFGILLLVLGAMMHDVRFLLWFSIPFFVIAVWSWARTAKSVSRKWGLTAGSAILIIGLVVWIYMSLKPAPATVARTPEVKDNTALPVGRSTTSSAAPKSQQQRPKSLSRVPQGSNNQRLPKTSPSQTGHDNQQTCIGSACAQGEGAQAVFNQFGAPLLTMTDSQRISITKAMNSYAGIPVQVQVEMPVTPDAWEFARKLTAALKAAGMDVTGPRPSQSMNAPVYPGVAFWIGSDRDDAARDLNHILYVSHISNSDEPNVVRIDTNPEQFMVVISPNR